MSDKTLKVFTFKADGLVHAATSTKSKLKRGGFTRALCARRFDETATRLAHHHVPGRNPPITCASCSASLTGLVDALETDFGFENPTTEERWT